MNVKISVKKLFNMEQMYLNRIESNKRRYRREVRGWEHENQRLKDNLTLQKAEIFSLKEEVKKLDKRLIHEDTLEEQVRTAWAERHGSKIDLEIQCKCLNQLAEDKVHCHLNQLAEINALNKECDFLNHDIEGLKQQLDTANARKHALDEQCEALKLEVEGLKSMIHPAQVADDDEVLTEEEQQQIEIDKKMSHDLWGFGKDPDKFR